jgi:UDP-GlcNAc:undecaprenyl-phosphate GlcNAc-1-phosphate transferase
MSLALQGLPAYLTAFIATLILIQMLARVAPQIGLVDLPGGHKRHEGQVPLIGGIAMFCGFLFGVLAIQEPLHAFRPLFAGAALLVIVGVLDDFRELGPRSRFLAQIGAGLAMTLWGGRILENLGPLLGNDDAILGGWAIPFTIFGVAGVINAVNMLDGVDGLAGGLAALAFLVLGAAAYHADVLSHANTLFVAASAAVAFLLFNMRRPGRRRATVFMGDAGSMFLGFVLAWFLVDLSQAPERVIAPVTALWILAVPLMDTVCIMFRRLLRGRSPFLPDREHLHHLLQRLGLSVGQSVWGIIVLSGVSAGFGLWVQSRGLPDRYQFASFLSIFGVYFLVMSLAWWRLGGSADEKTDD